MARKKHDQLTIEFRRTAGTRGGRRPNAGRPRTVKSRVPHRRREALAPKTPVHITLKLRPGLASLRTWKQHREIRRAIVSAGHGEHFRVNHYSLQRNHLHLICEATNKAALGQGMKGLGGCVGRRLNDAAGRRGKVFVGPYHREDLTTPRQVRHCLRYVLSNWRHHGEDRGDGSATDPFSSADLFDGWQDRSPRDRPRWLDDGEPIPVALPRFWLLVKGWRRSGGALCPYETPGKRS